jgi:type II secretory pathway pseudopilin PulG
MRARAATTAYRHTARRGFTLVELIVVITLMILASAAVVPSYIRFHKHEQLDWAAWKTRSLAIEARALAISRDTVVSLVYEPADHVLRMDAERPETQGDTDGESENPRSEPPPPPKRAVEYPFEVDVDVAARGGEEPRVRFYPDGRADDAHIRLSRDGFPPIVLTINPRNGRVTTDTSGDEERRL